MQGKTIFPGNQKSGTIPSYPPPQPPAEGKEKPQRNPVDPVRPQLQRVYYVPLLRGAAAVVYNKKEKKIYHLLKFIYTLLLLFLVLKNGLKFIPSHRKIC